MLLFLFFFKTNKKKKKKNNTHSYIHMRQLDKAKGCLLRAYHIRKHVLGPDDDATQAILVWITHHGWAIHLAPAVAPVVVAI